MPSLRFLVAATLLIPSSACGSGSGSDAGVADTPDARERNEAIARSGLPGATGVGGALGAADSAAARAARLDSAEGR